MVPPSPWHPPARAALFFAALTLAGALGCDPPRLPDTRPVGEWAIRVIDDVPRWAYDDRSPPVVRTVAEPEGWRLVWSAAAADRSLPFTVHREAGYAFLVTAPKRSLPHGPAELSVRDAAGRVLARWPVRGSAARPSDPVTGPLEALARAVSTRSPGAAVMAYRLAALRHGAIGHPTEAARALRMAARVSFDHGRLVVADALIDEAEAHDGTVEGLSGPAQTAYARSRVAYHSGDLDRSVRLAGRAVRLAEAAWVRGLRPYAAAWRAAIQGELGHYDEALAALEALRRETRGARPDLRMTVLANLGWTMLRGVQRRALAIAPARIEEVLRDALRASETDADRAEERANLAALAHHLGDRAGLAEHIRAHRALDPQRSLVHAAFVDLLDGDRALREGDLERALARFDAVARRVRGELGPTAGAYHWQARLGRARVHRAAGRVDEALTAYRAALRTFERTARGTAIQRDRALFFADHDQLYEEALAVAVRAERAEVAFSIADARRARVMQDIEQGTRLARLTPEQRGAWAGRVGRYLVARERFEDGRDEERDLAASSRPRWRRAREAERRYIAALFEANHRWLDAVAPITEGGSTADEIGRRLAPDEALWSAQRVRGGWIGLLLDTDGVAIGDNVGPLPRLDSLPAAVEHLWLVGVPPTAAPALWDRVSTASWSHAGALRRAPERSGPAVAIGDPDGTLPGAEAEAAAVAEMLDGRLVLGSAADRRTVRGALAEARVVHFAGHGVLEPASPWDAHLALAGRQRLTLEDLLLIRATPRLVVLSSCETGRAQPLAGGIAASLADGFIAAGAGSVVAATRPVPDGEAAAFMRRFYAAGGAGEPARALRAAALAARAAGESIWDAFHLWGAR